MKALNMTTGTTHYAHSDGTGLVQNCGIKANQTFFLTEVLDSTPVTCRKCTKPEPKKSTKTTERKTFGEGGWSLTELREMAKDLGVTRRTVKSGEELLSEISAVLPHVK